MDAVGRPALLIRRLEVEDVPAVARVLDASFERAWTSETVAGEIAATDRSYHGAFVDDQLVGLVGVADLAGDWHVMTVAVAPDHRRRGMATALMRRVLEEADRVGAAVTLEVRERDEATRRLYGALGFQIVGQRPRYYRDEAAVLMTRQAA